MLTRPKLLSSVLAPTRLTAHAEGPARVRRSPRPGSNWPYVWTVPVALASLLVLGRGEVLAATSSPEPQVATAQPTNEELLREMKAMEKRMRFLEGKLRRSKTPSEVVAAPHPASVPTVTAPVANLNTPAIAPLSAAPPAPSGSGLATGNKNIFGLYPSPVEGLKLGMYGELRFGTQQNSSANGQWQNGFDAARIVLLPSFQFTDNIIFNAEIEFEHAGSGFDNDDKLHGTAEIEQAYVDFKVSPYLNFRAPGVDLVPVGYTNLYHEPTLFYSVRRPELANGLIPTTWKAPSTGIYGKLIDNLNYQFQLSSSLEDFGDNFEVRTDANGVPPFPTAYAPGIDGRNALGFAQAPLGDFRQLGNSIASTLRLSYTPPFVPGLGGSTSVYFSPNTTPRGAHSDIGTSLGHSSLALVDSELRYRVPESGWEFRGEYAQAFFGNPANLRANNDTDPTNNVGSTMWGVSGEVAYHFPLGHVLGGDWQAVPFYRFTYEDLQAGGFRGTDLNTPIGAGKLQFHTVGVAVFPTPQLVLKLNYQKIIDREPGGAKSDSVLGSVGFLF